MGVEEPVKRSTLSDQTAISLASRAARCRWTCSDVPRSRPIQFLDHVQSELRQFRLVYDFDELPVKAIYPQCVLEMLKPGSNDEDGLQSTGSIVNCSRDIDYPLAVSRVRRRHSPTAKRSPARTARKND